MSKQKYVEITVSDNGIGINKEMSNKLFDKANHITTDGTENEKGSGLGLKLCKEFVEKMEGIFGLKAKKVKEAILNLPCP